jgi:hypothetical protein
MRKTNTRESGFGIVEVLLIVAVLAITSGLGWLAYDRFFSKSSSVAVTNTGESSVPTQANTSTPPDPYAGWKTYTSTFGGGLSFKYPADWDFNATPPDAGSNINGGKSNTVYLYSSKPQIKSVNGGPVTTNQFMCVYVDEYSGQWSTADYLYPDPIKSEKLADMGGKSIHLNTYPDNTLGRNNKPMGNIMRLVSAPSSSHGSMYTDLKNGVYFAAYAQYNCVQGGEGIKNLDDDYFSQPETIQAELILKSVSF